jgi:hypothetical protein
MASFMPSTVFGELIEIGRSLGQPRSAELRSRVYKRLTQLNADLQRSRLTKVKAEELKHRLVEKIGIALFVYRDMNLSEKIVFHHALDMLNGEELMNEPAETMP